MVVTLTTVDPKPTFVRRNWLPNRFEERLQEWGERWQPPCQAGTALCCKVLPDFFSPSADNIFMLPDKPVSYLVNFFVLGQNYFRQSFKYHKKFCGIFLSTHFYSALFELCGRIFGQLVTSLRTSCSPREGNLNAGTSRRCSQGVYNCSSS